MARTHAPYVVMEGIYSYVMHARELITHVCKDSVLLGVVLFMCCISYSDYSHFGGWWISVCLGLPFVPEGSWYCAYCKYPDVAARKARSIEPLPGASKRITVKLRRVVEVPIVGFGGCVICRLASYNFSV